MTIKTYSFEDGKYQVDRDVETGQMADIRRHGEYWSAGANDYVHSKFFYAMLNRIDELEKALAPIPHPVQSLDYSDCKCEVCICARAVNTGNKE